MDGGTHVGLFGAIRRETKGALRSLGYDLRRSKRFRRLGVIAVATVAGGVLATGALVREPVPGMAGLGDDDSGIIGGWFGLGSDTSGQDAESSTPESASPTGEAPDPNAETSSPAEVQTRGGAGGAPAGLPDLLPVGGETPTPGEKETDGDTPRPTEEAPTTEAPTTEAPTEGPTSEAPTEEPTSSASLAPTSGPTPNPTTGFVEQAPRQGEVPVPRKGPVGP